MVEAKPRGRTVRRHGQSDRFPHRAWLAGLRGLGLGDEWERHVVGAPRFPLLLHGVEREAWLAALHGRATGYLKAAGAMLPEAPVADDYREVIAAADELRRVLARFGSGSHARAPPIDPQLALVRDWAEVELSRGVTGGRPANELARTAVRDLLLLYWHGYGRKPSRALAGPTRRFVSAFFDGIRGKEVELVGAWRPGEGEELPPRRAVPCPAAGSIPDLIRETLPRLTSEPLPAWWGNLRLKTPTFSRLMRTRGKA